MADAARERIAILGVEPRDNGDRAAHQRTVALAHALTDGLRERAVAPATGYELAPNSQKELLEVKLLSDCIDEAPECMATMGREIGADVLLYGHLEHKRDGSYTVTLQSLTVAVKKPGPLTLNKTLPEAEATEPAMRRLALQVFPEAVQASHDTTLIVETNVSEGSIYVNGARRGAVAAGKPTTIRGLPPGSVTVGIDAPGFKRAETTVDLRDGEGARTYLTLDPEGSAAAPAALLERGPRPGKTARVLFWTSLVATGAGVAAFTITGLKVRSIEKEQDDAIAAFDYQKNGVMFPSDACKQAKSDGYQKLVDICDRGKNMATITNVLIGATAVAAVATAFFYWRGYLAPSSPPAERTARRRHPTPSDGVVFAPEVWKNGAGLGAVIQF